MADTTLQAASAAMTQAGADMDAALAQIDAAIAQCVTRQATPGGSAEEWPELAQWLSDLRAHRKDLYARKKLLVVLMPPTVKAAAAAG